MRLIGANRFARDLPCMFGFWKVKTATGGLVFRFSSAVLTTCANQV